jgi:hypothetical protein
MDLQVDLINSAVKGFKVFVYYKLQYILTRGGGGGGGNRGYTSSKLYFQEFAARLKTAWVGDIQNTKKGFNSMHSKIMCLLF